MIPPARTCERRPGTEGSPPRGGSKSTRAGNAQRKEHPLKLYSSSKGESLGTPSTSRAEAFPIRKPAPR